LWKKGNPSESDFLDNYNKISFLRKKFSAKNKIKMNPLMASLNTSNFTYPNGTELLYRIISLFLKII
jgi:hypothetical protein